MSVHLHDGGEESSFLYYVVMPGEGEWKKFQRQMGSIVLFNVAARLRASASFSDSCVALLGTFTALKMCCYGGQALYQ